MKLFVFQKFSFNHIFFLFHFIVTFIREGSKKPLFGQATEASTLFYKMFITNLSHFLTLIPLLIICCISKYGKKENKEKIKNDNEKLSNNKLIYNGDFYSKKKKNIIKYTLIVSIFDFIAEANLFIFAFLNNKNEIFSFYSIKSSFLFNTLIQYITNYLIFRNKLYKHHYLTLTINFITFFIFLAIDIYKLIEYKIADYQYYILLIVKLVRLILFCLKDNYSKHVLHYEFLSTYSLELHKAIYKNIFFLIFSIPFIFLKTNDLNIKSGNIFTAFYIYFEGMKILYTFIFIIIQFLYVIFMDIIIDRFSPNHLTLCFMLESFAINLYVLIANYYNGKDNDWQIYFNFFIFIFIFIGAMIYNEVLIINKWGFNKNTKLFLDYKFQEEDWNSKIFNYEDDDDENNTFSRNESELSLKSQK